VVQDLQAAVAWSSLPFVGEQTLVALLNHTRESRCSLAELWRQPVEDLARLVPLHVRTRRALETQGEDRWAQAAEDAAEIRRWGADLLLRHDPEYPPALRSPNLRPWPLLFAYGSLDLLEEPRVAIVNSRDVSHAGLAVTDALADALARRDVALVTSQNRLAYQAAAVAAKRHAGPAILAVDRGLRAAFPAGLHREPVPQARVWDEAFDPDLQLLLSPFRWSDNWTVRSGPRRDALIFDLADLIVTVDLRPDGNITRECVRALGRGAAVVALDRGAETSEGSRALWEGEERVSRIRWKGGEAAAGEIVSRLPQRLITDGGPDPLEGWRKEIAQFLARACLALDEDDPAARRNRCVGSYPAEGVVAQVGLRWSEGEATATEGLGWLLADLTGPQHSSRRPEQLLERVARGGLLGALVPVEWLEADRHAAHRAAWLKEATLRAVVRLPQPAVRANMDFPTAAVVLQRTPSGRGAPAPIFEPRRPRVGRFDLRRYLQETLMALSSNR
jgi:hypothetical protein